MQVTSRNVAHAFHMHGSVYFHRPVYSFFPRQRSYAQCFDFYVSQNVVRDRRAPQNLQPKKGFLWSAPVAFRRIALETSEWTSSDSNHHRQSVSAGKTNAILTAIGSLTTKKRVVTRGLHNLSLIILLWEIVAGVRNRELEALRNCNWRAGLQTFWNKDTSSNFRFFLET